MGLIPGHVDEYQQPGVTITVRGARADISLDAAIDTGFDGHLCLPVPVAIELGLELYGAQRTELGDGSIKRELVFRWSGGLRRPCNAESQDTADGIRRCACGRGIVGRW